MLFAWLVAAAAPAIAACQYTITDIAAAPAASTADDAPPAVGWESVTLPDVWGQRWPAADTVWYRIRWQDHCGGTEAVALAVSGMTMTGTVYVNDSLLWRDASQQEPFSRSWNMPRYWVLPAAALRGTDNVLWFRVTGMRHDMLGLGEIAIGEPERIWALHGRQTWLQRHLFTLNLAISLVLGSLFLALWTLRRKESAFGWYALASLAWAVFAGTMLATSTWFLSGSADWNRGVTLVLAVYSSAFCHFTWAFGGQRFPRLSRALWGLTLLLALTIWQVPDERLTPLLTAVIPACTLVFLANCIQFQFHAWRNRQRHNILLALCLLCFMLIGLHDLLLVAGLMQSPAFLLPLTSPIAMTSMFLIVADRFTRYQRRIETFNSELQLTVEDSRRELTRTLQRKHLLETSNIRLKERLRLSHDLHDSLGSSLMRSIATVEQSVLPLDRARVLSMLKELRDDLRQIIDNSSSNVMSDKVTPTEWIAPLRHRFVRLFDELGLISHWRLPPAWPGEVSSIQLLALTRFVEEALTNAIKHSRCGTLEVSLSESGDGGLMLEVRDDGIGFDVNAVSAGHGVGMRSMRARIDRIGGRLTLESGPEGTRHLVHLARRKDSSADSAGESGTPFTPACDTPSRDP